MKSPFPKEVYQRNSQIYKLMANPIRLEILNILEQREAQVAELRNILKIQKANLSQHLSLLRQARLVKVRKESQRAYYSIIDPRIIVPCRILKEIWEDEPNK